jgi:hypothetical protein
MELIFPKDGTFPSRERNTSFEESIAGFIKQTTRMLQEEIQDGGYPLYLEELAASMTEASQYIYYTRKYRDKKLAEGFEKYPKPQYNSEAQVALARQYATEAVRLHELMKDLRDAIRLRITLGRERINQR